MLTQVTVTGDIGTFKGGQVLTEHSQIADYIRTMVNASASAPTSLTDEQILAVADSIDGEGEDWEVDVCEAIENGATGEIVNVSAATGDANVEHGAELIPAEVDSLVRNIIRAGEDVKAGPVTLYHAMSALPDPENDQLTLLDRFPRVGTSHKDTPKPNNPETYQGRDTDGKVQEKNYFTVFFRDTPTGKEYAAYLEAIKASDHIVAGTDEGNKFRDQFPDIYAERNNKTWKNDATGTYTKRMAAGRQLYRKVAMIRDVLDVFQQYEHIVRFRWNTETVDGAARMKRTHYPLWMVDAKEPSKIKPLPLSDFLKFHNKETMERVEKLANGGVPTWENFGDALKRVTPPKTPEGMKIDDMGTVQTAFNLLSGFFDIGTKEGKNHASALLETVMKDDEACLSAGSMYLVLDGIWSKFQGRYDKLRADTEKASGVNEKKVA